MSHRVATTPRRGKSNGNNNRNQQRRSSRDETRGQSTSGQHSSQSAPSPSRFNPSSRNSSRAKPAPAAQNERIAGEGQNMQLIRRVLLDEDEFQRRNSTATQLIKSLEDALQNVDPVQVQQEGLNLIDLCLLKQPGVQSIFENARPASNALKGSVSKLVSTLALCACRLDIVFMWVYEHLHQWGEREMTTAESTKTKEFKLWLLRVLRQTIMDAASDPYCEGQLYELSANLTSNVIMFLDAMDSPDYLPDVLQVLDALANCCPVAFSESFQDIIDLLVGWHIDPTLPEQKKSSIGDSYITFRAFWQNRLPFAFELLQHFLSDMQGVISNVPSETQSNWSMCESFFSCFHSMLHAVVPLISTPEARKDMHIVGPVFDQLRINTFEFLVKVRELSPSESWMEKSNEVLLLFFTMKPQNIRHYQWQIYYYFASQIVGDEAIPLRMKPQVYLKTLMKLVDAWGLAIDQAILQNLLNISSSPLYSLRTKCRDDKQLNSGILVFLRTLIRLCAKDASVCQSITESYTNQLGYTLPTIANGCQEEAMANTPVLHRTKREIMTQSKSITSISAYASGVPTRSQATDAVVDTIFIVYLLLDAASVWPTFRKHHFIVVLETLVLSWECKCYDVSDACLQLLIDSCSSSRYLLDNPTEFSLMVFLLQDLYESWPYINMRSRQIISRYFDGVIVAVQSLRDKKSAIIAQLHNICKTLLGSISSERNNSLKEDMIRSATKCCKHFGSSNLVETAIRFTTHGLDDPSLNIRLASTELISALNPFITADMKLKKSKVDNVLNAVMATPHTGSFRPAHYEIVMVNLGMSEYLVGANAETTIKNLLVSNGPNPLQWEERLFYHCDSLKNIQNAPGFSDLKKADLSRWADCSKKFLTYWAMWESSRYCILSRLRTPFGGPEQTLAAFERMLSGLTSMDMNRFRDDPTCRENLSNLLLLLDRLEVQIYNASNGSATNALPAVPRSSLAFFRTNKKTCQDYYARIRPKLLAGAKMLHDDAFLIRNGLEALKEQESLLHEKGITDVRSWFGELNALLCDIVNACIRQTSSDLIHGIQSWYRRLIKSVSHNRPSFQDEWLFPGLIGPIAKGKPATHQPIGVTWFQVAGKFATAQHECAIRALGTLHEHIGRDEYGILDMLDNHALDYYTCIEDYEAIKCLYDANGSMFSRILSQELMIFANTDRGKEAQPTCDLADFYTSLKDLNVTESLEVGRLVQFQHWISTAGDSRDTQKLIDGLLADRAQLSLEGVLPVKSSLVEMQIYRQSSINLVQSLEHYLLSGPSKFEYDTEATKTWGRLVNYLNHYRRVTDDKKIEPYIARIQIHAAKAARKESNTTIASQWLSSISNVEYARYQVLYEKAKGLLLRHDSESNAEAMDILSNLVSQLETSRDIDQKLYGKACLAIAKILKEGHEEYVKDPLFMNKLCPILDLPETLVDTHPTQSPIEIAMDTVLRKPVDRSTKYSKPWFQYATYHYKQGWKVLDDLVRTDPVIPVVSWAKSQIIGQLNEGDDSIQLEKQIRMFLQKHSGAGPLKDDTVFMRSLQQYLPSGNTSIVATLQTLYDSVIDTFRSSANAYFQYLSVEEYHEQGTNGRQGSTSMVITATLRLLRILIKYGDPLQDVFLESIERVRIEPWKRIIPQLFARLNHPAKVVQQVIGKLLGRICAEYPREMIYDVIVSHTSSKTNRDTKHILDFIANQMMDNNVELWTSTQRMAEELEKITVLWEERWSYKIASLAFNVMELMPKLDQEVARLESNREKLSHEQTEKAFSECYDSVMKFIVSAIDKLLSSTIMSSAPKTPHEQWFTDTFGKAIKQAFDLLQNPKSMATYREGWDMFIQINKELVIETHKVRILELQNISPYLASLKSTQICVPGVTNDEGPCFIESFDSSVVILPTKTKPKKLDLRGSDGKKYSYLFKGLEDLHLDERVMQLLNTVNGLLLEDKAAAARFLKTRTYAVIPLSDHSGMIQWVNDATPLFALYKRWQRREQAAHALMANDKNGEEHSAPQRPTEIFMKKIENALRAENLRVTTNRRHWPKHILKKVFLDLVKETPGDLLSKEIWCSSSDTAEWLRKSTSFSRSLAVMSVIGYIIGLGDRHLDNMLVDYQSGEIIHIDYNVCFEKGRQLRVPELVPFRLTQNLFHALGITGVDGIFRNAAEETLRVLRKHKEVLMTLLDAFVYDPLVHWANEAGETEERQMMELQANLGLVAARLGDKKIQYDESQRNMTESIARALDHLQRTSYIEPESILDEGSDDDGELENEADIAKKNILAMTDDFKLWNKKHIDTISSLVDDTKLQHIIGAPAWPNETIIAITGRLDRVENGPSYQHLIAQLSDWSKSRTATYQYCVDALVSYKQLVQPVVPKLLSQDICGVWGSLEELSTQSFQKNKAEEVQNQLQQDHFSQALQGLESRVFNFKSHIAQIINHLGSGITQLSQEHERLRTQFQADTILNGDRTLLKQALLDCLLTFEGAFRRLDAEEESETTAQNAYPDFLPEVLREVESHSHSGCFGQSSFMPGLLASTAYLESYSRMLDTLSRQEVLDVETSALKAVFPCTSALYSIEDECLRICGVVLQQLLIGGNQIKPLVRELQRFVDQADDKVMLCKKQLVANNQVAIFFNMVMKPFANIDRFCDTLRTMSDLSAEEIDSAITSYTRCKRQVVTCILRECISHVDRLPPQGWTSAILSSWAMTYNATISGHIKELVSMVTGFMVLPCLSMLLQSLRQVLGDLSDTKESTLNTQRRKEVVHALHQISVAGASERLLRIADGFKARYTLYLENYEGDIHRFQWLNAPYILKDRPLFPSQVAVSMSKGAESIHALGNRLQNLNEEFNLWHTRHHMHSEWGTIYQSWQFYYQEELKLCTQLLDVYNTINHLEICREGYTQAMMMKEVITNDLLPFVSSNTSEIGATIQEETPMLVAPEVLKEIQDELSTINKMLDSLKSPLDGILSLLESISIIEVDDASELKPVHQSAKVALDEYMWIQSNMKTILGKSKNQDGDWTLSRLSDTISTMDNRIQKLFGALHTLEDYGLDRQGDDQKQVMNHDIPEEEGSQIEMGLLSERGEKTNQRQSESEGDSHQGPAQTNQATQQRDTQVLSIMRRIRSKLEGKDFGVHQKMSVSEQVAKTIEQAVNVDNLCVMYEGWTSWV